METNNYVGVVAHILSIYSEFNESFSCDYRHSYGWAAYIFIALNGMSVHLDRTAYILNADNGV